MNMNMNNSECTTAAAPTTGIENRPRMSILDIMTTTAVRPEMKKKLTLDGLLNATSNTINHPNNNNTINGIINVNEESIPTPPDDNGDHNRLYCNICKFGGNLLCCDRCPRAFHLSCLHLSESSIPDKNWYCKYCAETLERRLVKANALEEARKERDETKRMRDIERERSMDEKLKLRHEREEILLKKKAKKMMELHERNARGLKVNFKDKEEEKLVKATENIMRGKYGEQLHALKKQMETIEKEERELKRREETMDRKRKYPIMDCELIECPMTLPPLPIPTMSITFPSHLVGVLLSVWDFTQKFLKPLGLSSFTLDQLRQALMYKDPIALTTDLHLQLLTVILEDRMDEDYVSDEEDDMDQSERWVYEMRNSPVTLGTPMPAQLTRMTWPSVLRNLILSVPRFAAIAPSSLQEAVDHLGKISYSTLCLEDKMALLNFCIARVHHTNVIREVLDENLKERMSRVKEFNSIIYNEKRTMAAQLRQKKEEAKEKRMADALVQKEAIAKWVAGGKIGPQPETTTTVPTSVPPPAESPFPTPSPTNSALGNTTSDAINIIDSSNESASDDESEDEESDHLLSRQDLLTVRKERSEKADEKRKKREERERRKKTARMMEKKRELALEDLSKAIAYKDVDALTYLIDKARDNGLENGRGERLWQCKELVEGINVHSRLVTENAQEAAAFTRQEDFEVAMSEYFIRTKCLGTDSECSRYWHFSGAPKFLFVEKIVKKSDVGAIVAGQNKMEKVKEEESEDKKKESSIDMEVDDDVKSNEVKPDEVKPDEVKSDVPAMNVDQNPSLSTEAPLLHSNNPSALPVSFESRVRKTPILSSIPEENTALWYCYTTSAQVHALIDALDTRGIKEGNLKNSLLSHLQIIAHGMKDRLESDEDTEESDNEDSNSFLKWENKIAFKKKGNKNHPLRPEISTDAILEQMKHTEGWMADRFQVRDSDWKEKSRKPYLKLIQSKKIALMSKALLLLETEVFLLVDETEEDEEESVKNEKNTTPKDSPEEEEDDEEDDFGAIDAKALWPSKLIRDRWRNAVEKVMTLSELNVALITLIQRCDVVGIKEAEDEEPLEAAKRSARARRVTKTDAETIVLKERMAKIAKKAEEENDEFEFEEEEQRVEVDSDATEDVESDDDAYSEGVASKEDDWDEECYVCSGGGSLACCDGCTNAFHVECLGLRRVPRGDVFCAQCQTLREGGEKVSADEDLWDTRCKICSKGGELICCDGCPKAFHAVCLDLDELPDDYFCEDCETSKCGYCKKARIKLTAHVICGTEDLSKGCDRVFHLECAELDKVPDDDWFCSECV